MLNEIHNNMYLLNPLKNKSVAHIWTGYDSACRMYSTGGLTKKKQIICSDTKGKPVCQMCKNVLDRPG